MADIVLGKRYALHEQLGSGGMALVYKGHDLLLDRPVAIKILKETYANDPATVQRFHQEAQAAARLSHPNVVSVYDVGEEGGQHYLVMEYVAGQNLRDLLKQRGRLPWEDAVSIACQVCEALQHAHDNNIVHRDVKPHNILVTSAGRVKVTDFGLARALVTEATITYPGAVMGSVHYLSPEQARGQTVGKASDIYSLGVVLYEMLTGQLPFQGETPVSIAIKHIQEEPPSPRSINPEIPAPLEKIVLKAMQKDAGQRYATPADLAADLGNLVATSPDNSSTRVMFWEEADREEELRPEKRNPWLKVAIVVAIIAAALYGLYAGWQYYWMVAEVTVPSVVNLPLAEAQRILEGQGLRGEKGEERHDPAVPQGYVLDQEPRPGSLIKLTRPVVLDVSLGPAMTQAPSVLGKTERDARLALEQEHLVLDGVRQAFSDAPAGTVIEQEPAAGTPVKEGSGVVITVSQGPKPQPVTVPPVVGLSLDAARQRLSEAGLEVGVVTEEDEPNYEYPRGIVTSQSAGGSTALNRGDTVDLTVSPGPGPQPQQADVEGITMPPDGREHQLRIEVQDATGAHEAYNRTHSPGEVVEPRITYYGDPAQVKVRIYLDEELIYEGGIGG